MPLTRAMCGPSAHGTSVVVTPGAAYGPSGEGYVRLSLTLPDDRLEEAVRRIEERVRL